MARQVIDAHPINVSPEEMQSLRYVVNPKGQQHYTFLNGPRGSGASAVSVTTLEEVDQNRTPLATPSDHGVALDLEPRVIDFADNLPLVLRVSKEAPWRRGNTLSLERGDSLIVEVGQLNTGRDGAVFYESDKLSIPGDAVVNQPHQPAQHLVGKLRLCPRQPMRTPQALQNGVLRLTIRKIRGRNQVVVETFFALPERLFLGAIHSFEQGFSSVLCGIPYSGKTTTGCTAKNVMYNHGRFTRLGLGGDRSTDCEGATTSTEVFTVLNLTMTDFVPILPADVGCHYLDMAGCDLDEVTSMGSVLFDDAYGLNVTLDLSKPENRRMEVLMQAAEEGRAQEVCKTFVPQSAICFLTLGDLFYLPAGAFDDYDCALEVDPCDELRVVDKVKSVRNFSMDMQRVSGVEPVVVVTKVDSIFSEYEHTVGLLPSDDLAKSITKRVSAMLHVSERNVILACMRPDNPPDSVPDHVAFFRCAMASLWILRQGRMRAEDQVQAQQDRQLQEMIGYEKPQVVKKNAAAACDAFKKLQLLKAKQKQDEKADRDRQLELERREQEEKEEAPRKQERQKQEAKRGWFGTFVESISPFKKHRTRDE